MNMQIGIFETKHAQKGIKTPRNGNYKVTNYANMDTELCIRPNALIVNILCFI